MNQQIEVPYPQRKRRYFENDTKCFASKKIYGRDYEILLLKQSFERISFRNVSEIFFLRGETGVGKTCLVEQLYEAIADKHACFCVGKFDQTGKNHPHSILIGILNELCCVLTQTDDLELVRRKIRSICGKDLNYLLSQVPGIGSLLGENDYIDSSSKFKIRMLPRFNSACRRFLAAVTAIHGPVVILLDDIDFADMDSLQVIQSLITDQCLKHVLIIATCRAERAKMQLLNLDKNSQIHWNMNQRKIESLTIGHAFSLLSDIMENKSEDQVCVIGNFLFQQTRGNAYYMMELIRELETEKILLKREEGYALDENNLNKYVLLNDSFTNFLRRRIETFDKKEQNLLFLSAFLGFEFDSSFLKEIVKFRDPTFLLPSSDEVDSILHKASRNRLLRIESSNMYIFMHNIVQMTLLTFLPDVGSKCHFLIGRAAWNKLKHDVENDQDWLTFESIIHLNQARSMMTNEDDIVAMIKLNLDASKSAKAKSCFAAMADFLRCALTWAGSTNDRWKNRYGYTLFITNQLAEAYEGMGYLDKCKDCLDNICENVRYPGDEFEIYFIWIRCLQGKGHYNSILSFCLNKLQELGEKIPRKISRFQMNFALSNTQKRLKVMSDSAFLLLPEIRDEKIISALKLLSEIILNAAILQLRDLLLMSILRSVQMTLVHGRCAKTAFILASYGILCTLVNDEKEAYRFGELGKKLNNSTLSDNSAAATICVMATFCLHWQEDPHNLITLLGQGYRVGYETGDIEWSIFNGIAMIAVSLESGRHLHELEEETRIFCESMRVYNKQRDFLIICYPIWQGISNLIAVGRSKEDFELTGDIMNQGELEVYFLETNNCVGLETLYYARLQLACYFNIIPEALAMANKLERYSAVIDASFTGNQIKFFSALAYIRSNREKKTWKYFNRIMRCIKDFERIITNGTISCEPFLLLLQAEMSSLKLNKRGLKKKYDDAVASAQRLNMVNIQALANECAGGIFVSRDAYLSDHYLTEALEYYYQWGAMGKVEQMEKDHGSLLSRPKVVTSVSSSRGTISSGRSGVKTNKA